MSIVDHNSEKIFDSFIKSVDLERIVDYQTKLSGVRREDVETAPDFSFVMEQVKEKIRNKLIVGHSLENDLRVMKLSRNRNDIR